MNQLLDHIKAYPGIDNGTKLWEWKLKLDELAEQAATRPSGMKAVVDAVMFWNSYYWPTGGGKRDALWHTLMQHCISNAQFDENYAHQFKKIVALQEKVDEQERTILRQQQELDAFSKAVAPIVAEDNRNIFKGYNRLQSVSSKKIQDICSAYDNRRVG